MRHWIAICENNTHSLLTVGSVHNYLEPMTESYKPGFPHLPRKFWLNPKTGVLLSCGDHVSAVMGDWEEMGLPANQMREWEEHLSQYLPNHDDDSEDESNEDYEDALDENQGQLLSLAMSHGWVRGGDDFIHHDEDKRLLQGAARILRDEYGIDRIIVHYDHEWDGWLDGSELDRFIKYGRLPT